LGRFIGLPVAPFAIVNAPQAGGRIMFASFRFNYDGRDLDPILPEPCVKHLPDVCAGVMMLDVWVTNADRHDANLSVDRMDKPSEMKIFDHDCALFGVDDPAGVDRLTLLRTRLGVTAGPKTKGFRHIFLDAISSSSYFDKWILRIYSTPNTYIDRLCNDAQQYGLTAEQSTAAAEFLKHRRDSLPGLLNRHREEFKGIASWEVAV
jgi:hypothetical protein